MTNFIVGVSVFGTLVALLYMNITGRRTLLLSTLAAACVGLLGMAYTM